MGANVSQRCCDSLTGFFRRQHHEGSSDAVSIPRFPSSLADHGSVCDKPILSSQSTPPQISGTIDTLDSQGFGTPRASDSSASQAMDNSTLFVDCLDGCQSIDSVIHSFGIRSLGEGKPPKKLPSTNSNRISQYAWLRDLLQAITSNDARDVAQIANSGQSATPLFIVAGACPCLGCGMQAMMYSLVLQSIQFWWVKPQARDIAALDPNTLKLNTHGEFKNATGQRANAVYKPLAIKFNGQADGDFTFSIDHISGRAYIDEKDETGIIQRLFLYFVWQESWSSVVARKQFMKGKLFYQKEFRNRYFAREYEISNGQVIIMEAATEEDVPSLLPPDVFQDLLDFQT